MPKIIDIRTRKKWTGSRTRRPPVKVPGQGGDRVDQGGTWQPVGLIADRIVRRLEAR